MRTVTDYWRAVTSGEQRGATAAAVRAGLHLLSGPLWLGLQANLAFYRWGLLRQARVNRPVIAVGNLTLGGTGKTTATAYLVRRLAEAGRRAGVVLRGHGRRTGSAPLLVSDGTQRLASVPEAGDEALLLASLLPGHPVAVGVRREQVARLLLDETPAEAIVLDDAFQYFRLAREAEIVLVDASHRIEDDRLFPAGTLREPHAHLRRATHLWITHAELVTEERVAELRAWLERTAPGLPVTVTAHRMGALRPLTEAPPPPAGCRVVALSGLGNPLSFEAGLRGLGYDVHPLVFPDHHPYQPRDWDRVQEVAVEARAEHVITTEKDAVKLPPPPVDLGSVHVLRCDLEIRDGAAAVDGLVEAVSQWHDR
jgi:tetraacyldisaccharide 4'-kinase